MPDLQGGHSLPRETVPTVQGVYDVLRGGRRHRRADEDAAARLTKAFPGTGTRLLEERAFTSRVVTWAAHRGVRQFIIAAAGAPALAGQNAHDAVQAVQPGAVTVYASGDPFAAAWNQALLAEADPLVGAVEANISAPDQVLRDPGLTSLIDLANSVCVVVPMALHFARPPRARLMLRGLAAPLAAGSTVAVSAWTCCEPEQGPEFDCLFAVRPIWRHSETSIARWMTAAGLGIEPQPGDRRHSGVVDARLWPHRVWAAGSYLAGRAHRRRRRGPEVRPGARNRHRGAEFTGPEIGTGPCRFWRSDFRWCRNHRLALGACAGRVETGPSASPPDRPVAFALEPGDRERAATMPLLVVLRRCG